MAASLPRLVVVGAGMAAARLLERICDAGGWAVTLINAEPRGSYDRIRLSPFLSGEAAWDGLVTHDDAWYAARGIRTLFGTRAAAIDRAARVVVTDAGERIPYDRLVLATGSEPLRPDLPGADLPGVGVWRDREDTEAMIAFAAPGRRAAVIGGGLLGLEAAAGMARRGAAVTVVHRAGHPLNRQLDPVAGGLLAGALAARGIDLRCGAGLAAIEEREGRAAGLRLADGTRIAAEFVVLAAGVAPEAALARASGLQVSRGVIVDDAMRSSDPAILAVGECTEHRGRCFGLVAPCHAQAETAARTLRGETAAFAPEDAGTMLKVTGCDIFSAGVLDRAPGLEELTFLDPARGHYRRLLLDGGRLAGVVLYGDTADAGWFLRLLRARADVTALRETLVFGPDLQGAAPDPLAAPLPLPEPARAA